MAKISFGTSEHDKKANENITKNLPLARLWLERHQNECFTIRTDNNKHTLKAFMSPDGKIIWFEFRSTSLIPSLACPIALCESPENFQRSLDHEWKNILLQVKKQMESLPIKYI